MTKLSVNLNKVATVRNTRNNNNPSLIQAAITCINAGAKGITLHPRPDERHIKKHDVAEIAELLQSYPEVELNLEGNPFHNLLEFAKQHKPTQCTLVPDAITDSTSNKGWNLKQDLKKLIPIINELKSYGTRVSLFMYPDLEQINLLPKNADRIELFTEEFAKAYANNNYSEVLNKYSKAAEAAISLGFGVNAGHDLDLNNLPTFLKNVKNISEVSIGHAIIADALYWGLEQTVKRYLEVTTQSNN